MKIFGLGRQYSAIDTGVVTLIVTVAVTLITWAPGAAAKNRCSNWLTKAVEVLDQRVMIKAETWSLKPETELKIQAVFTAEGPSDTAKIQSVIELMLMDRAQAEGSVRRVRMLKTAMDTAFARNDWYSKTIGRLYRYFEGPHYSLLANRVSIADALDGTDPSTAFTYVALLNQAFDRNFSFVRAFVAAIFKGWNNGNLVFRVPLTPLLQNRVERSAIGSHWELVRRLPPATRKQMLRAVREHQRGTPLPEDDRAIFKDMLETGAWERLVRTVKIMQARGDVPEGKIDPVVFFDDPTTLEFIKNPVRRRKMDELRRKLAAASTRLLERLERREQLFGYLNLNERDLKFIAYLSDLDDHRAELRQMMVNDPREPLTAEQTKLSAELERDYRGREMTEPQILSDRIVEMSLVYAHLPKEEFIKKVELIYEKDTRHLMREDLFNPFTKIKIAMALEAAFELTYGGHVYLARDVGLFIKLVAGFF